MPNEMIPLGVAALIDQIVANEGGYGTVTNGIGDSGGLTNSGITYLRWLKEAGAQNTQANIDKFKTLSHDEIQLWYYDNIYTAHGFNRIMDPALLYAVMDMALPMGESMAIMLLQRTLHITVDGVIGSHTAGALLLWHGVENVRQDFIKACVDRYITICKSNPGQIRFLQGWINRAWSHL